MSSVVSGEKVDAAITVPLNANANMLGLSPALLNSVDLPVYLRPGRMRIYASVRCGIWLPEERFVSCVPAPFVKNTAAPVFSESALVSNAGISLEQRFPNGPGCMKEESMIAFVFPRALMAISETGAFIFCADELYTFSRDLEPFSMLAKIMPASSKSPIFIGLSGASSRAITEYESSIITAESKRAWAKMVYGFICTPANAFPDRSRPASISALWAAAGASARRNPAPATAIVANIWNVKAMASAEANAVFG